jgi:hypothetical protein
MAIKCNCPAKCEIHPKSVPLATVLETLTNKPPEIDAADQLQFKRLENSWMEARLAVQAAQQQLEMFGAVLFQKYGVDGKEFQLDQKGPTFTPRKG